MEKNSYLLDNPPQDKGSENCHDRNGNNGKWLLNENVAVEARHNIDYEEEAPVCDWPFVRIYFFGKAGANENSRYNTGIVLPFLKRSIIRLYLSVYINAETSTLI